MKRTIAILIALAVLGWSGFGWSGSAQAAAVVLSAPALSGSADAELKVPIRVRGAAGIGAAQADLVYDPAVLEFRAVEPGPLLTGLVDSNVVQPGRLRMAMATNQAVTGDGELFIATFKVLGGARSPLTLENGRAWALADGADVAVALEPGQLTVSTAGLSAVVLWAGAGAVAIVLLLIVVARRRKRKRPAVEEPQP